MNNDFAARVSELAKSDGSGLVGRMLEVREQHMMSKERSEQWMSPLKVLALRSGRSAVPTNTEALSINSEEDEEWLERDSIDVHCDRYIALSYVWTRTLHEEAPKYTWLVRSGASGYRPSKVRDAVLSRVIQYMKHYDIEHLWLDRECINQDNPEEQRKAMLSMDKVYSMSDEPLAVLFVPIRSQRELGILEDLLEGNLVVSAQKRKQSNSDADLELSTEMDDDAIYEILNLLHRLTSDVWWTRAWCFQEEHLAERDMKLLIPHYLGRSIVASNRVFGHLARYGDLVVSSFRFRMEATKFVFAYVAMVRRKRKHFDRGICLQILSSAGKYTLMGKYGHLLDLAVQGKSMSTLVLSDLRLKNYTVLSDILNIAANCNFYSRAINTISLDTKRHSLSIAILTMWFLNGEIFWNNGLADLHGESSAWCAYLNVFEYLNAIAFDACPDIGEQGSLRYRRKLRFLNPKITRNGVETSGHLFRISQTIKLEPDIVEAAGDKQVLRGVVRRLRYAHSKLAARLDEFIDQDFDPYREYNAPASRIAMSLSAANLVKRLRQNAFVGIGYLLDRGGIYTRGNVDAGIFAIDHFASSSRPVHVFTSWQQGSQGMPQYKNQPEEDKYVSLMVSVVGRLPNTASPLLRTEAWTDSLCFYEGAKQHPYTFPWPASLLLSGTAPHGTATG